MGIFQNADQSLLRFQVEGLEPDEFRVLRFTASEAISQLFEARIELASLSFDLDLGKVVGRAAHLEIESGAVDRHLDGIVTEFEQLEVGRRRARYRAVVRPRVWRLTQRRDSRIFQHLNVPEIVARVLDEAGIPECGYEFRLQDDYATRDYTVQYQESDWDFAARLLEDEGIFCFFEHAPDGHVLVFGDSPSAHRLIRGRSSVRFRPPSGQHVLRHFVEELCGAQRIRPGAVALRDFNFELPRANMDARQKADDPELEIYEYPGTYCAQRLGQRFSRIRLEELRALRVTLDGRGVCPRMQAGSVFRLAEHPRDDWNRKLLLVAVEHAGEELCSLDEDAPESDGTPSVTTSFRAIPFDVPFRPERTTARPVIQGSQTATVVGPGGEEIYTDEHGRVKLQFHWDREGQRDENSSCWVRVNQPWAGMGYGGLTIPRVGQEVIVDFLEGDPDRPIVTGRVYNGDNLPPQALPAAKARTSIKSNSYPGGGGSNEITMDDTAGQEGFYIHAQYDQTVEIGNNRTTTVGVDSMETIGNNSTQSVGVNATETVGAAKVVDVGSTLLVKAGTSITLQCGASSIHMNQAGVIKITGTLIKVGASILAETAAPITITRGNAVNVSIGGANHMLGLSVAHVAGAGQTDVVSGGDTVVQGAKVKIN
jgi:type VI secretion system secreted protein VgrG